MKTAVDLLSYRNVLADAAPPIDEGRLLKVVGLVLEAGGCEASIGDVYAIADRDGHASLEAEVVGLRDERTLLMPLGEIHGLRVGATLRRIGRAASVRVGRELIGRVVDGLGRPLDGKPMPLLSAERSLHGSPRNPLLRKPIERPFSVGVRAIDGLLTLGEGQRVGIFAGGGVGKSSLLGMMVRNARADVAVVGLIGERGREVEDFVRNTLGEEGLSHSVVVAATSADPPLVRARGALYASAVAEYFRSRGLRVLLVMDSLTRYAMALREIGLAIGEPPATKGYTPSVFALLPQLLERAGNATGRGSITGLYTVLVEGDDLTDPIADAVRAALDGHIVLSRELAEQGHYPAIDVPRSISRVMPSIVSQERMGLAMSARETLAAYREVADLVAIGAYRQGAVPKLDAALTCMPALEVFLKQATDAGESMEDAVGRLRKLFGRIDAAEGAQ
ncbi:MAG: FliI/YscN family ATPase [Myxococcales bacterium]|nr:FliI/YscN family ATPase [Myxococcales bacterium]MDD9968315.1 FliI/YscN family ATPase [Myxococcales bacterium]